MSDDTPNLNENAPSAADGSPRSRIIEVIETLKPYIQSDGGDIEFVDFTSDGVVQVRLHGACVGCPGAAMTLSHGVEARLKEAVPEVERVECVQ